jgi:hypothetical protein
MNRDAAALRSEQFPPAAQVDTTKSGATSDRTPARTEAKVETTAPDTTAK